MESEVTETVRYGAPVAAETKPTRPLMQALWRGACLRCPNCGVGRLFRRYLKVDDRCGHCGEALHHHRADDAPPYFTMFIVGHFVVGFVLSAEVAYAPPAWVHAAIWLPLTLISSLLLLPVIKGALVGYQWALYMHGFEPEQQDEYELAGRSPGDGRG